MQSSSLRSTTSLSIVMWGSLIQKHVFFDRPANMILSNFTAHEVSVWTIANAYPINKPHPVSLTTEDLEMAD